MYFVTLIYDGHMKHGHMMLIKLYLCTLSAVRPTLCDLAVGLGSTDLSSSVLYSVVDIFQQHTNVFFSALKVVLSPMISPDYSHCQTLLQILVLRVIYNRAVVDTYTSQGMTQENKDNCVSHVAPVIQREIFWCSHCHVCQGMKYKMLSLGLRTRCYVCDLCL